MVALSTTRKVLIALGVPAAIAQVDLSEELMDLSLEAAILSTLSYEEDPDGSNYDIFHFFKDSDSPDQAIVAKKNGFCFGVYRGTDPIDLNDWFQNIDPRTSEVCDDVTGQCCSARYGFVRAFEASYRQEMESALRLCAAGACPDIYNGSAEDGCVVLTGHSQGGAIATLADVALSDLNPYLITFGQPSAVHSPCDPIRPERAYRFINTVVDDEELEHDLVPFAPGLGADEFGYMVILSAQETSVAGYPLNDSPSMLNFHVNVYPWGAHDMDNGSHGYVQRIKALIDKADEGPPPMRSFPVHAEGWNNGDLCNDDGECISKRCDSICLAKLGTCEKCDEDADCESGKCIWGGCARPDGLVENKCPCLYSSDCVSGRCEHGRNFLCEPKLYNGESCNEDTDCLSGKCSWWFRCHGDGGLMPSLRFKIY